MFPVESVRTWRSSSSPQAKRFGEFRDPPGGLARGKIIQAGKQHEIFSRAQARIKAGVRAGVVANLEADFCGLAGDVETADLGPAAGGDQQRRQDSQQRGFSRAIGSDQGQNFALF